MTKKESWVAVGSDMGEDWFLCVNLYDLDCCVSARNLVHDTNTIAADVLFGNFAFALGSPAL